MALDKRDAPAGLKAYWARVESCMEPVFRIQASVESAPVEALTAVIAAAERLAATDDASGPARLWSGEEGEALATRLTEVLEAIPDLPDQRRTCWPACSTRCCAVSRCGNGGLCAAGAVRCIRASSSGSPRSAPAKCRSAGAGRARRDRLAAATDPGPWLSRPMRAQVGLPTPEDVIGQAAHDFTAIACPPER